MKKIITSILIFSISAVLSAISASAKNTETVSYKYDAGRWAAHTREMEKLDRGLVAINTGSGVYLSWRLFDNEDERFGSADSNIAFNIYRGNDKIATVQDSTNYTDKTAGASYSVAPVINGQEGEKCVAVSVQNGNYFDIPLQKPADVTLADGNTYSYTANDASCGDLNGDGEYEIILKWDCNGQDNSNGGYTGNVLLDAYKQDGTFLWRVDLGQNVRAGAHYTQFLVYDFDGDGKAEMMCQTAPGSKGSDGNYVTKSSHVDAIKSISDTDNQISYINEGGYNLTSDEFLTVFESDGKAGDTIYYPNQRIDASVWGDAYGNRCDRFTATVAYLDGEKPYGVYMRGYYFGQSGYGQRQAACAVTYDGTTLNCASNHSFDTYNPASYSKKSTSVSYANGVYKGVDGYKQTYEQYVGQGNHNCTVADVDNDGNDEVITGALCYEFDGNSLSPKWCTFKQHGDALHIGDYDPTHEGFEFFTIHEDGFKDVSKPMYNEFHKDVTLDYGMSVIDAETGNILFHEGNHNDTGRGIMANIGAGGYYQIYSTAEHKNSPIGATKYSAGPYKVFSNCKVEKFNTSFSANFRIFWDSDLYDELLDGIKITSWNADWNRFDNIFSGNGVVAVNGTKNNPSLQADLFGDWREEVVYPTGDNNYLRVYSTTTETNYKIKALMHDPVYRMGVSAEQTAYNQPPHTGLYLSSELFAASPVSIEITSLPTKLVYAIGETLDTDGLTVKVTREDGTVENVTTYQVSGFDSAKSGTQTITVSYFGKTATFDITVKSIKSINVTPPAKTVYATGQSLNTAGMVVTLKYEDGSSSVISYGWEITGFDSSTLGKNTVTVTYAGKSDTFDVEIIEGNIVLINGRYETDSSSENTIPIGNYMGDFTIEHNLKINSFPANGNDNKSSTDGFFVRFTPQTGVGAGWYISNGNIYWKSGENKNNGKKVTTTALKEDELYQIKYNFTDVGTGNGAYVTMKVYNSDGAEIGSYEGLNLRNMTFGNTDLLAMPLSFVQIFNQSNGSQTANVEFSDAKIYDTESSITSVDGETATIDAASLASVTAYAVKYGNDGSLTNVRSFTPDKIGTNTFNIGFVPDKVYLWNSSLKPIDLYDSTDE